MMINGMKCILKSLFLIIAGSLVGLLLLSFAFLLPVHVENKAESLQILEEEGWYPLATVHKYATSEYFHSYLPGVMDNHTDAIMISTAADETIGNPVVRAVNMYSEYRGENYIRYWHGYVTVLRPLLYFFDYAEIRILNGMAQILLMLLLAHVLWQKRGMRYAVLLLTAYALLMPMALAVSLQFSWVFYIGTLGCLILLTRTEYWVEKQRFVYFFVALGLLTSYFDLLTYPLFTWGFPMIWWLLTDRRSVTGRAYVKRCAYSGLGWSAGYFGMWATKWIWAALIAGRSSIAEVVGKIHERTASMEGQEFTFIERLDAAYTNWKHYEYSVYMLILVAWLLWLVVMSFRKGWHLRKNSMALLLAAAAGPIWYFVLANHTREHHFFTYRIWNVTVLAVLGILLQATDDGGEERDGEEQDNEKGAGIERNGEGQNVEERAGLQRTGKEQDVRGRTGVAGALMDKRKILGMWALAVVCGVVLALTAAEPVSVLNGSAESVEIPVQPQSCIEVDFTPIFSKITQLVLILNVAEAEGFCEIEISSGNEVLYCEQLPLEQYAESTYGAFDVNWKLKAGKQYELTIRPVDTAEAIYVPVTVPHQMPLSELQNMVIGGQETDGQPIMGFTYLGLPTSKKTLLFLTCSFSAACAAVILVFGGCPQAARKQKNSG